MPTQFAPSQPGSGGNYTGSRDPRATQTAPLMTNGLYMELDPSLFPGTPENIARMAPGVGPRPSMPPGPADRASMDAQNATGNSHLPPISTPEGGSEEEDPEDPGSVIVKDKDGKVVGKKPKGQQAPQGGGAFGNGGGQLIGFPGGGIGFPGSVPGAPGSGMSGIPGAPSAGGGMPSGVPGSPGSGQAGVPGAPGFGQSGIPGAPQSGQTGMSSMPGYGGGMSMGGIPGAPTGGPMSGIPGAPSSGMPGGASMPDTGSPQPGSVAGNGQSQGTPKGPYVPPSGGQSYFPPNLGLGDDPYGMNGPRPGGMVGGGVGGGSGGYGSNVPTPNNMISQQEKDAAKQFLEGTFGAFQQAQDAANAANTGRYDQQMGILSGLNTNNNNNLGDLAGLYGQRTQQYGQGMNNVVGKLDDRFSQWASNSANVGRGYDNLNADIQGRTNLLGQTQAASIDADYAKQMGQAEQDLISRGLGNTTIRPTVQRGINYDNQRAKTALAESVNNTLNQNDMSTRLPMLSYGERATNFGAGLQGDTAQTMQQGIQGIAGLQGEGLAFGERANAAQTNLGGKIVDTIGARNDIGPSFDNLTDLAGRIAGAGYGYGSVPSLPAPGTGQQNAPSAPSLPYYTQPAANQSTTSPQQARRQPWATIY